MILTQQGLFGALQARCLNALKKHSVGHFAAQAPGHSCKFRSEKSGTDMTGRPGYRTMEMIGGSAAPYLARTRCVPLFCTSFNRVGNKERFRLPGAGGGSFPLYGGTFARSYSVSNLKTAPNIKFLGGIFLAHLGPRRRDIPDKNFMQVAFFCCFRQGVAGMSRDLGRDVPDLEKLYARKLWADFSYPVNGGRDHNPNSHPLLESKAVEMMRTHCMMYQ